MAPSEELNLTIGENLQRGEVTLGDIRLIKRHSVCNKSKKEEYISAGAIPAILKVLNHEKDQETLIQASQAIGSLCTLPEGAQEVVRNSGIETLLTALRDRNSRVEKHILWALKLTSKEEGCAVGNCLVQNAEVFQILLDNLGSKIPSIAGNTVETINYCCLSASTRFHSRVMEHFPTVQIVALLESQTSALVEEALKLLKMLLSLLRSFSAKFDVQSVLIALKKLRHHSMETRLVCCECISLISTWCGEEWDIFEEYFTSAVLELVSLLNESEVCVDAVKPLCSIVSRNQKLKLAVIELDAIPKLVSLLEKTGQNMSISLLNIITQLCENNEKARRQSLEGGIVTFLKIKLNVSDHSFALAACKCLHVLSRSYKALKTGFIKDHELADALMDCARLAEDNVLASHASCILANLCLDPSCLRVTLLRKGVFDLFLGLLESDLIDMKCYGLLGLSSISYLGTDETKEKVSKEVPWKKIAEYLKSEDQELLENTLILLRNVCHKTGPRASWSQNWPIEDILAALSGVADRFYNKKEIIVQCLFTVVNIASGPEVDKQAVVDSNWCASIPRYLLSLDDDYTEAATWLVQNLATGGALAPARLETLHNLEIEDILRRLGRGSNLYIKDRAMTALDELTKSTSTPSDSRMGRFNQLARRLENPPEPDWDSLPEDIDVNW
eukprot:jgi/Picsp_1/6488/NSC_03832-R1_armadillo repeat-containing protein 8-like